MHSKSRTATVVSYPLLFHQRFLFSSPYKLEILLTKVFPSRFVHLMGIKREFSDTSRAHGYFTDPGLKHPTVTRAEEIDYDLPYERLRYLVLKDLPRKPPVKTVAHWFRYKDLRIEDNKALSAASKLVANNNGAKLITVMIIQPKELDFHGVGHARRAFMVDNIRTLQSQLGELNIPLVFLTAKSCKNVAQKLHAFAKENDVSDVFANYEYEHDELARDIAVAETLNNDVVRFKLFHDQTVIEPGNITNAQGEPRKVFTSFWQAWIPTVAKSPDQYLMIYEPPSSQEAQKSAPKSDITIDDLDSVLNVNRDACGAVLKSWPIGHQGAIEKLDLFLSKKIHQYGEKRSIPAEDCVSRMSPYFALGLISPREALAKTRKQANAGKNFGTSSSGVDSWVREIVFREHYRQMTACVVPHIAMNMPSSLKLANIENEEDEEAWERWCEGKTGMPFVDAGMRQLNAEGYMHNRCRMNVSSYLRMNLLIDFRLGERFFANRLLDWDCCNNSFGWDPNYTVFNPVLQGEKCDPQAKFIKKWVPELKDVQGKAVFDPHGRLSKAEFEKLGYPAPMIDQDTAKTRSVDRFKSASAKQVKEEEA